MLSSISPLGERARHSHWGLTTVAYVLASALGGLSVGGLAGLLGGLLPASWRGSSVGLVALALLLLGGLAADLGVGGLALPTWRRQVDEAWLGRYRGWVTGLGFGAQLGFGVVTIVTSATTYATVLLSLLSGTWGVGAAVGLVFGVVRALPLVALWRVEDPGALHAVFRALERWARPADAVARAALLITALGLLGLALAGA